MRGLNRAAAARRLATVEAVAARSGWIRAMETARRQRPVVDELLDDDRRPLAKHYRAGAAPTADAAPLVRALHALRVRRHQMAQAADEARAAGRDPRPELERIARDGVPVTPTKRQGSPASAVAVSEGAGTPAEALVAAHHEPRHDGVHLSGDEKMDRARAAGLLPRPQ